MTETKEALLSANAFPNVKVYGLPSRNRPVIAVRFENTEERPGWWRFVSFLVLFPLFAALVFAGTYISYLILGSSAWNILTFIVLGIVLFGAGGVYYHEDTVSLRREILLDFDQNRLVVKRKRLIGKKEKTDIVKPLEGPTGLHNLTIEPHAQADDERIKRGGKLGIKQKQHCLVGWFGPKGAARSTLVCRVEWPNMNSLFEVRQATEWALELGENFGKTLKPADDGETGSADAPPTIKPPLD